MPTVRTVPSWTRLRIPTRRTIRPVAPLLLVILLVSGCRSNAEIRVHLDAAGKGFVEAVVRLDAQAAAQIGDPGRLLRVADLRSSGWLVRSPERRNDGGLEFRARKDVAGVRQAEATLHELASGGVLDGVHIRRVGRVVKRGLRVRGMVDLSPGVDSFGDDRVREVLGGTSKVGVEHAELVTLLGAPAADAIQLELIATLDGRTSRIRLPLGAKTPVTFGTAEWYGDAIVPGILSILALGGLVTLWFVGRRGMRS